MSKKKNILKISVGIPVYNEEENISQCIKGILKQENINYHLNEIIIYSDGSTDKTVDVIKKITNSKIKLFNEKTRKGKSYRVNQIIKKSDSDILILVDADVTIKDKNLLNYIAENFHNKFDLATVKADRLKGKNNFQNCINFSSGLKNDIKRDWNQGNNYLTFQGCFLILSKKLTKSINLPRNIINDDAYIYFSTVRQKMKIGYMFEKKVYVSSPKTFLDHLNQSSRFKGSYNELKKYFSPKIKKYYKVPGKVILKSSIKYFRLNPFYFTEYLLVFIASKILKLDDLTHKWQLAKSTKGFALYNI